MTCCLFFLDKVIHPIDFKKKMKACMWAFFYGLDTRSDFIFYIYFIYILFFLLLIFLYVFLRIIFAFMFYLIPLLYDFFSLFNIFEIIIIF